MNRIGFLFFLVFKLGITFAQEDNTVYGKIYGDNKIAEYIKISNIVKNTTTFSDENGNFSFIASVGDSIMFSSAFYEKKIIVIDANHFSEIIVVQLKDKINKLDEVVLKGNFLEEEFNPETYSLKLNTNLIYDIKNRPWEYRVRPPTIEGINLKGFKYLNQKLFPKNEEEEKYVTSLPISYNDLITLNINDEFFNDTFFRIDLKIPADSKYLFFEYFENQKISSKLLNAENRHSLIEKFFEISGRFLTIINQVKTPENKILNDSNK